MPTTGKSLSIKVSENSTILQTIVDGLCQLESVEMNDLEPIYDTVDVDFLERLLSYSLGDVEVKFRTNGWYVTAMSDEQIVFTKE